MTRPHPISHEAFLEHPVVEGYVSLRVWGAMVPHRSVVVAELQARTAPGARVFALASQSLHREIEIAARLPDREFDLAATDPEITDAARREVAERQLDHVRLRTASADELGLEGESCAAVLSLYSLHRVEQLEAYWSACRAALRPDGVVLAQEYLGPNRFDWPAAQLTAATDALESLVPERHKRHHDRVDSALARELVHDQPELALRSEEIVARCRDAGFEIAAQVDAGCALLHPVLTGQIDSYDPFDWDHNAVLAALFRAEDQLMRDGTLGHDFGMFVALPS